MSSDPRANPTAWRAPTPELVDRLKQPHQWFAVALSSIGEGVITADAQGLITLHESRPGQKT